MSGSYGVTEKRVQIIETAYSLFKRNGFHATGIDRIIEDAGVAKMTMYRHFPNKDALIVEVLRYRSARFERQLDELDGIAAGVEEKIEKIFQWHQRWFKRADFHGCLFQHALAEFSDPESQIYKTAVTQKLNLTDRMRTILRVRMPSKTADTVAIALVMLLEGATLLAQMRQGEYAIKAARQTALQLIASAGEA